MISNKAFENISFIKKEGEEIKILFLYRYISLLGTSLFYFIGNSYNSIQNKIFIVVCLTISSIILTYLYIKNEHSSKKIGVLVFIETIGNSLILIPSGGLNSPYVWYALNTILIASVKLSRKYCWINLSVYLFISTGIAYFVFDDGKVKLLNLISRESNLILSFILITAAMRLLSKSLMTIRRESKNLAETNNQVLAANKKIKESMEHIMALYQAVHLFSNQRDRKKLIKLLIEYTRKIMKANDVFFYCDSDEENKMVLVETSNIDDNIKKEIRKRIYEDWDYAINSKMPIEISIGSKRFIIIAVKSTYKVYGILGVETTTCIKDIIYKENVDQIIFLSGLSSIVLERFYLQEVNERLLITEEQNRIADEIHDSVLQRLFSMSCGVFTLMRNLEKTSNNKVKEELNIIRNSMDSAMKDLRSTIYGLSWKKDGSNTFEADVRNYIDEIKRLNNVNIYFEILGNHELLSARQKKALYRIICEGIGNSLHHGRAKDIEIKLDIGARKNLLKIKDNGTGFDIGKRENKDKEGIGLRNIHCLAHSLNGEIDLESKIGKGTLIKATIPNIIETIIKEEVV